MLVLITSKMFIGINNLLHIETAASVDKCLLFIMS